MFVFHPKLQIECVLQLLLGDVLNVNGAMATMSVPCFSSYNFSSYLVREPLGAHVKLESRTNGAFTLDVKSVLNENLGGNPRWYPMLNGP